MPFIHRNIRSGLFTLLGILSGKKVFSGPRSAALILSRACNSKCIMCWYHSPLLEKSDDREPAPATGEFMDDRLCREVIDELAALGTYKIIMGGHGEPTLHPQFDNLLDLVIGHRMMPYVISNGLTLDNRQAELWSGKPAVFRFSLHAGDIDTWLEIHPECTAAQYDRLSRCLKQLAASKTARVAVMHAVQRANFRTVRAMFEHARQHGIKEVQLFPVRADGCLPQVTLNPEEERELSKDLEWCLQYARKNGIRHNITEYLASNRFIHGGQLHTGPLYQWMPCYLGWSYTQFDVEGQVQPCENSTIIMGHAGAERFRDIWCSARYDAFRKDAVLIPKRGTFVDGCVCENCPMSKFNINIHNLLHLKSFRIGEA